VTEYIGRSSHSRHAAGLTLIELMVALAIGSVLILGLVQVFGASRAAYVTSEGMSRVQENARFALEYLQRDIRMAGHFGCVNDQAHWIREQGDLVNHFTGATATTHPLNFNVSIQGFEATNTAPNNTVTLGAAAAGWSPALPAQISTLNPLPGSDIIALRYLSEGGVPVTALSAAGTNTVVSFADADSTVTAARRDTLTSEGVAGPTLFGVSDCSRVDVFPVSGTNLPSGQVTSNNALFNNEYTVHASGLTRLYRANSVVYYVALNNAVPQQPALFRARFNGTAYVPEELVEGIESLQFLYGRDNTPNLALATPPSGTITLQDTANTLGADRNQWLRVGLVQVGLLARSPNPASVGNADTVLAEPRALGVRFAPSATADARYRGTYESTVALRNRLFGN
jgi:type IV pilus assembly protein PilW